MSDLKVFISHSNDSADRKLIYDEIIPTLEERGITICRQDELRPGRQFYDNLKELITKESNRFILFVTENSIRSPWCDLELVTALEKSQRENELSVLLLFHGIDEEQIPPVAFLQEAPKVYFTQGRDQWAVEAEEKLKAKKTIGHIMPAGNVAHGLVWSHYFGYSQHVIPEWESALKKDQWYNCQRRVSPKLYEIVPKSCTPYPDLSQVDDNIKKETILKIKHEMQSGNFRTYEVIMYSVTDGDETFFFTAETPTVLGTMKAMEDHHLAKFETHDKKLQLARFYYTMNSVLNHFDKCREKARVLLYNDETEKVSEVLLKAIKEDLHITKHLLPEDGWVEPMIDNLEENRQSDYQYQVYVARAYDDKDGADEIIGYLKEHGIQRILENTDLPGQRNTEVLVDAVNKCRWFIFLLTKNSLKDKYLSEIWVLSALYDGMKKGRVRVIPVVDRRKDVDIPEALQWVTYVPYNEENKSHLRTLHNIVSGEDLPFKTELFVPAGDVAYGLAWGYVAGYLRKVLSETWDCPEQNVLKGINQAFKEKKVIEYRCPEMLFILIPKSCDASANVKDKENRIHNFTKTPDIRPDGPRPYYCQIYEIRGEHENLYFVGQYAAPITCLNEMSKLGIAGINEESMTTEAERFYEIVSRLMEQAEPKRARYCEFMFYDDTKECLADLMEKKLENVELKKVE